jgi:hypothetical protein
MSERDFVAMDARGVCRVHNERVLRVSNTACVAVFVSRSREGSAAISCRLTQRSRALEPARVPPTPGHGASEPRLASGQGLRLDSGLPGCASPLESILMANDHVERMVQNWFERTRADIASSASEADSALTELITAIHRMVREAENDIRRKCEEIAVESAGEDVGGRVALAIRTTSAESLPRKSLIEIHAPDLSQ